MAILLHKYFPLLQEWTLQIIASDISTEAIARAREGRYSNMEIQRRLRPELRDRYFTRIGNEWRIDDEIRLMVDFYQIDLLDRWPILPQMDAILLRNILIYLNDKQKRSILKRMRRQLRSDGYLFLGANETIFRMENRFETLRFPGAIAYQPVISTSNEQ